MWMHHKLHLDMGHFSSMQRTIYRQLDIIETQMSNKEETSQQDHPPKTVRYYVCVCVCAFVRFFNPCPNKQKMSNKLISVNVI